MGISELFDFIFENNFELQLYGSIDLYDDEIKWSYDALGDLYEDVETHLQNILDTDLEAFEEFFSDNNLLDAFTILPPEFDDTLVSFHIVEE